MKLSRRDFLKASAALALLSSINWAEAAEKAVEAVAKGKINIIWFESQSCTGDTTSLIQATNPSIVDVLVGKFFKVGPGTVAIPFHDTIMPEWGEQAVEILRMAERGAFDPYVLVIEGSIPDEQTAGSGFWCVLGEENGRLITCSEWINRLLKRAVAVVAVGNCASYGGIPANKVLVPPPGFTPRGWSPSPTGAIGFFDDPLRGYKGVINRLDKFPNARPFHKYIYEDCKPKLSPTGECRLAVAVPGCPANGDGILRVLAHLVLVALGLLPAPKASEWLDKYWRPKYIFGRTVHEQCPRAGFYAAGDFRKNPGDNDARCLFSVGCKGPVSNCPWNKLGWVNGVGGPTRTGGVCIGCTMPGFSDVYEPFYKPLPAPTAPTVPQALALALGSAVVGAAVGYALTRSHKG